MKIDINIDQYLEIEKITLGVFSPLDSFMNEADFFSCVETMRLANGEPFPIPVVFDIDAATAAKFKKLTNVELHFEGEHVADIAPTSVYAVDKLDACQKIFATSDTSHPGVAYFLNLKEFFASGELTLHDRPHFSFSKYEVTPAEAKSEIELKGWEKVAGFQTRNIPHRAHEYLQKVALEHVDGLMIQPLVGFKKPGDFLPEAVILAYENLIENYFPSDRVFFTVLSTVMRYAGPREAIFHAIVRRNYGCTHFIVGRDHAGVGDFYDKYAAHRLAKEFEGQLGIDIMRLAGPYYCNICGGIVTDKTCPHHVTDPSHCQDIAGTEVRELLLNDKPINSHFVRRSVIESLAKLEELFVT